MELIPGQSVELHHLNLIEGFVEDLADHRRATHHHLLDVLHGGQLLPDKVFVPSCAVRPRLLLRDPRDKSEGLQIVLPAERVKQVAQVKTNRLCP